MPGSNRRKLHDCLVAGHIPYLGQKGHPQALKEQAMMMKEVSGIRSHGATALDLAYVAAGRLDAIWQYNGPSEWDFAAGIILICEAAAMCPICLAAKTYLVLYPLLRAMNLSMHKFWKN